MKKKIGVLLSGCGFLDGSEIHESVLTILALDKFGAKIVCMAPDMDQYHVINHITNEEIQEKRNVLIESARISRGNIFELKNINSSHIDGLILPGGFGAVKNLSDFAIKGSHNTIVHPEVKRILDEMIKSGKPIGAICIAPATITKALSDINPEVTIGTDIGIVSLIEAMGGKHYKCSVEAIHVDKKNKIVTTPAYMLGKTIKDVAVGIEKLVEKIMSMI